MTAALASLESTSARDVSGSVLDTVAGWILDGEYGVNARLPPERMLAERLGVSRISVRAALARLESRGMIEIQPGSGTVVRARHHWSFAALGGHVRHAARRGDLDTLASSVREILAFRRFLLIDVGCRGLRRPQEGELDPARESVRDAWRARESAATFLHFDLEKMRRVLVATESMPSLWLLNSVADAYLEFAEALSLELLVPDDYVEFHLQVFAALERGDTAAARRRSAALVDRQDLALLAALGVRSRGRPRSERRTR